MHRQPSLIVSAFLAIALGMSAYAAPPNTTGLPSYPHDAGGTMDAVYRSIPTGQVCIHYSSNSPDALADVEAWYKKQLPGAKTLDVNDAGIYGHYFKLDGIMLLSGNDFVTVYRMANQKDTSIELFKCKAPDRMRHGAELPAPHAASVAVLAAEMVVELREEGAAHRAEPAAGVVGVAGPGAVPIGLGIE